VTREPVKEALNFAHSGPPRYGLAVAALALRRVGAMLIRFFVWPEEGSAAFGCGGLYCPLTPCGEGTPFSGPPSHC